MVRCTNTCCKKVINVGTECIVIEGALTVPFNTNKAVTQKFYYCLYALCITNRPPWTNIWPLLQLTFKPLNAKFTKWTTTLNQFVGKLPTNCLGVIGHFVGLAFIGCSSSTYCYFECVCNFFLTNCSRFVKRIKVVSRFLSLFLPIEIIRVIWYFVICSELSQLF